MVVNEHRINDYFSAWWSLFCLEIQLAWLATVVVAVQMVL